MRDERRQATFQSHTDGDHLPGADASELVTPPRPGRAGLRHAPRIIELYQIFPFIVNYGTIRMELWIGCAPLPLDGFRRVRPQTSFNLLMSWIPLDGSYLARIHYDEVSVALMHSCQFKKGG